MAAKSDSAKRAETALRIAQLKFKQALKREENATSTSPPVSLESSASFCDSIDAVLQRDTTENVQECKKWIITHIAHSKTRATVLGEYLVAVSKSVPVEKPAKSAKAARNRYDLLLVVNDVLHEEKYHRADGDDIAVGLNSYIAELAELAAEAVPGKDSPLGNKLKGLISHWAATGYITNHDYTALRECVEDGLAVAQGATPQKKRRYALPEWFGDRSVAWSNLSASYMLEPLLRNPDRPIPGSEIKIMRFEKKKPSEHVQKLLENYFDNIDLVYCPTGDNPTGETKKFKLWLDPMGQMVKKNKETGETSTVGNGYGWSTKFCQEMQEEGIPRNVAKLREKYKNEPAPAVRKSRWNSPPRDHGRESRSPRRYSYSSQSRSRSRSHSFSRSRSRSSYGSRSRSRSSSFSRQDQDSRPKSGGHYHQSSRKEDEKKNDRRSRFEDRGRPPPGNYSRKRTHDRQERWQDNGRAPSDTNRDSMQRPQQRSVNVLMSQSSQGPPQAFVPPPPTTAPPPYGMSGHAPPPPPPPPAGQLRGYPNQGFPQQPLPAQHFQRGIAPPPSLPSNSSGQFHGGPFNASGFHNNTHQFGGYSSYHHNSTGGYQAPGQGAGGFQTHGQGTGGYQANGQGTGGHQGHGQRNHRGGYQGGQRGGHRGGFRGQGRGQGRY